MKSMLLTAVICIVNLVALAQTERYRPYIPADSSLRLKIKSEPRFYINVHTGYSLALGSTFKFYPDEVSSIVVKMADDKVVAKDMTYGAPKKGLGEGFRVGGGIAYVVNDFINAGLDVDYFKSTIRKIRDSSVHQTFSSGDISARNYNERYTISYNAALITFSPALTLKAISKPKWFLYNKIAAVFTFRPNSIEHDSRESTQTMSWQGFTKDSSSYSDTRYEWVIKNPSFGFSGAVGAQFKFTEKIRLFSEIQFSHVVFVVSQRQTTSYIVNGQELVNNLTLSEKRIDFEENFKTNNWIPDPNQPNKAVTQRIPITYVGIQAGLVYRF